MVWCHVVVDDEDRLRAIIEEAIQANKVSESSRFTSHLCIIHRPQTLLTSFAFRNGLMRTLD